MTDVRSALREAADSWPRSLRPILELIAERARIAPYKSALEGAGGRLSYGDLVGSAARLADSLRQRGAGAETVIGIGLERSIDHAIAVLAALWSGAAFLPLDPAWPAERLRWVLDDAGAQIIIASEAMRDQVGGPGREVISGQIARGSTPNPMAPNVHPDQLAYVIYTSGSTGEPKGVEIPHQALANLVAWHRGQFPAAAADRTAWTAGLGFDASIWELLAGLGCGATVCIPDERERISAEGLKRWLVAERVTLTFVSTPLAEAMIGDDWPANTALRALLTGGDVLHARPRGDLPFEVVNNYGPAECAVVATSGTVTAEGEGLPGIGRPIAGVNLHILGESGAPTPVGEVGEICIGGAGVGRGYRNRPALTAERFVFLASAGEPEERCYRTGDLGLRTKSGEVMFRGRNDDQIQHRGQRIEPDEVSAALMRRPGVARCAVIAGGEGLIAYVTPAPGAALRGSDLRDFLAATLPHYMLPSTFVRADALPTTANGKLDRSALPTPSAANSLPNAPYRAPVTPAQTRVAGIIGSLLGVDDVGLDDNFFLLGGHSLLGTQLVLRLQDAFGAELTLRDLFEAQTVQGLANKVEGAVVAMVAAMGEEELQLRLAR